MTGWFVLLLLIALSLAALWLLRIRGAMLQAAAAALLLGASGYALQGRPGLAGAPAKPIPPEDVEPLAVARHAFFGQFTGAEAWLSMSEALASRGNTKDAVGLLRAAVRQHPGDPQLWIGLGNALVDHAHVLTPPAELAYDQAAELAPGYPAPLFFLGLALARSGDREGAVHLWRQVLVNAPANASWRPLVESAVAALGGSPPLR